MVVRTVARCLNQCVEASSMHIIFICAGFIALKAADAWDFQTAASLNTTLQLQQNTTSQAPDCSDVTQIAGCATCEQEAEEFWRCTSCAGSLLLLRNLNACGGCRQGFGNVRPRRGGVKGSVPAPIGLAAALGWGGHWLVKYASCAGSLLLLQAAVQDLKCMPGRARSPIWSCD
jgi:hypothetical protein